MKRITKKKAERFLAGLLALVLVFTNSGLAYAAGEPILGESGPVQQSQEDGQDDLSGEEYDYLVTLERDRYTGEISPKEIADLGGILIERDRDQLSEEELENGTWSSENTPVLMVNEDGSAVAYDEGLATVTYSYIVDAETDETEVATPFNTVYTASGSNTEGSIPAASSSVPTRKTLTWTVKVEAEKASKTSFSYNDDNVTVTAEASIEAGFPEDAEIHVDYLAPDTDKFSEAVAMATAARGSENVELHYAAFYDIYFTSDSVKGEDAESDGRIQPKGGLVTVTMNFTEPVAFETTADSAASYQVIHITKDDQVETVTKEIVRTDEGKISEITFSSGSFSIFGIEQMSIADDHDLTKKASISVKPFITASEMEKVDRMRKLGLTFTFQMPESCQVGWASTFPWIYDLNEVIDKYKDDIESIDDADKLILDNAQQPCGQYTIKNGVVSLKLSEDWLRSQEGNYVSGTFTVDLNLHNQNNKEGFEWEFPEGLPRESLGEGSASDTEYSNIIKGTYLPVSANVIEHLAGKKGGWYYWETAAIQDDPAHYGLWMMIRVSVKGNPDDLDVICTYSGPEGIDMSDVKVDSVQLLGQTESTDLYGHTDRAGGVPEYMEHTLNIPDKYVENINDPDKYAFKIKLGDFLKSEPAAKDAQDNGKGLILAGEYDFWYRLIVPADSVLRGYSISQVSTEWDVEGGEKQTSESPEIRGVLWKTVSITGDVKRVESTKANTARYEWNIHFNDTDITNWAWLPGMTMNQVLDMDTGFVIKNKDNHIVETLTDQNLLTDAYKNNLKNKNFSGSVQPYKEYVFYDETDSDKWKNGPYTMTYYTEVNTEDIPGNFTITQTGRIDFAYQDETGTHITASSQKYYSWSIYHTQNANGFIASKIGTFTKQDEVFTWTVQLGAIASADDMQRIGLVDIVDKLPEGHELVMDSSVDVSVYCFDVDAGVTEVADWIHNVNGSGISYTAQELVDKKYLEYDKSSGKVTLKLSEMAGGEGKHALYNHTCTTKEEGRASFPIDGHRFVVTYRTRLTEEGYAQNAIEGLGSEVTYTNAAYAVKADDRTELVRTTGKLAAQVSHISKSSEQNTSDTDQVTYTVDINPHAVDLAHGSETLTLEDQIQYNAGNRPRVELLTGSQDGKQYGIRVAEILADGTEKELTNLTPVYDSDTQIITIEGIPNNKHISVKYTVRMKISNSGKYNMRNIAALKGNCGDGSSYYYEAIKEDNFTVTNPTGKTAAIPYTITLLKLNDNFSKQLGGAKFKLYQVGGLVSGETSTYSQADNKGRLKTLKEGETNENTGVLVLGLDTASGKGTLDTRYLYCLEEEAAPNGYWVNPESRKHYFVIYEINVETGTSINKSQQEIFANAIKRANPGMDIKVQGDQDIWQIINQKKKVSYQPKVKKIVQKKNSEKDVSGEKFTFTIEPDADYAAVIMPDDTGLEITGVENEKKEAFDPITFTEIGTYTFTIKESEGTSTGWTYDNSEWKLTVTVNEDDNDDGEYEITTSYTKVSGTGSGTSSTSEDPVAEFTNIYEPVAATYAPKVVKVVDADGMTVPTGDKYSFTLDAVADSNYGATVVLPDNRTLEIPYNVTPPMENSFGAIKFKKAGSYKFTIKEVAESGGHYDYDESKWTLTVTVEDADGTLTISSVSYSCDSNTSAENATFTNTYNPIDATWNASLEAKVVDTKGTLVKKPNGEAAFSYTIAPKEGGSWPTDVSSFAEMTTSVNTSSISEGIAAAVFGQMTFSRPGTYEFQVRGSGITGDAESKYTSANEVWTVTVEVTDNAGTLEVSAVYTLDSGTGIFSSRAAEFKYTYVPTETSWYANLQTIVEDADGEQIQSKGEAKFTYAIAPETGKEWPEWASILGQNTVEVNTSSLSVNGTETASFEGITFSMPGTYIFQIKEDGDITGAAAGKYSKDDSVWTVTVNVSDDENGNLSALATYSCSDASRTDTGKAVFKHKYTPDAANLAAKAKTKVTYEDGTPVKPVGPATFHFTIAPKNGNTWPDGMTKPNLVTIDVANSAIKFNGESEDLSFGNMQFKKPGTYTFQITEGSITDDVNARYKKDEHIWTVTVDVEDNSNGILTATAVYSWGDAAGSGTAELAEFSNIYTPQSVEWQATLETVIKDAKGTPLQPAGEAVFSYTIAPESGTDWPDYATEPTEKTVTVKKEDVDKLAGSNTTEFSGVTFSRPGTYTFKITEGNITGAAASKYTKDVSEWTVTVEVKDENGDLQISSVQYSRTGGVTSGDGTKAVFSHIYTPKEVEWNASAQAVVVNEYGEVVQPAGQAVFSFMLTPDGSWPVGSEGLLAKVVQVKTEKMTDGQSEELKFGAVTFAEPGEGYTFRITESEITGTAEYRYKKDDTDWTVTVKVEDTSIGELKVTEVAYSSGAAVTGGSDMAVFRNVYDPTDAHWSARVMTSVSYADGAKELVQPTSPAEFGFTISHKPAVGETEGVVVVEEDNVAISTSEMPGGSSEIKSFGDVTFKKSGEYKFEIVEKNTVAGSAAERYMTDSATWTVIVTVEDDATGTLNVTSVVYQKDGKNQFLPLAMFKNTYDPADAELSISAQTDVKYADGEQLKPAGRAVFHYTIAPADGEWPKGMTAPENTSITMAAEDSSDWIKSFEAMKFSRPGEYEFKVTEGAVTGDAADRYTPDSVEWTVKVTVTDEDGELKAGAYCYNGSQYRPLALFRNDYDPEDTSWSASLRTVVVDADGERVQPAGEAEFSYTAAPVTENGGWPEGVEAPEAETLTVKTSDLSNGTADTDFGGMTFAKPGTYTFRITEGAAAGAAAARYTSDGAEWTVTVHVTDSEDGALKMETVYTESSAAGAREARAAEAADDQTAEFRHIYKPVEAGWTASVQAEAVDENGEKVQPADDTVFGFTIAPVTDDGSWPEGVEVPESTTVSVTAAAMADGASGLADFEEMTFTKPGEYHFLIMESGITGATAGQYEKDGAVWTATVIVTDDETGTLTAVGGYICSDRERTGDLAVFRNIYRQEESQGGPDDPSENPTEGSGTDTPSENPTEGSGTDTPGENPTEGAGSDTPSGNPTEGSETDTPSGNPTGGSGTNRPSGGSTGSSGTDSSGSPAGGAESTPLPNLEVITDNPTPLSDGLELTQIDDSEVPLAFLAPVTGDDRPIGAAALFSLMALGMMGAFGILASKKDEDEA